MIFYRVCQWFARWIAWVIWGMRVEGREHLPASGPLIFASTHESFLDPVLVGCVIPPVRFLARKSLFVRKNGKRRRIATLLGRIYGVVELDRAAGGSEGLRRAVEELRAGRCLLLFPEGTRSSDGAIRPLQPGVGLIALRAGVPVVPVSMDGARHVWPKGKSRPRLFGGSIRIKIGEPKTYKKPTKAGEVAVDIHRRLLALRGLTNAPNPHDGGNGEEVTGNDSSQ